MTETTEACVRGCALYRQHLTECVDEACRGCLPRRAAHGHLCHPCHRRFELMLTDAPTVYRWLTGNMAAGQGAAPDDMKVTSSGDGPPLPIKAAIYDARQLLADRLTLWVDDWVEFKGGLRGPDRHTVEADSEYLLRWLHGVESLEWIGDWWDELAETMSAAHALAPWRPAMRRVPGVPCPGCEEQRLAIWGGEEDVTCLACRIVMTSDRFALWERVLKADQQEAEAG